MTYRQHVIPAGDAGPWDGMHFANSTCWCQPLLAGDNLVVHHASDGRESQERTTGKGNPDKPWIRVGEIHGGLTDPDFPRSFGA